MTSHLDYVEARPCTLLICDKGLAIEEALLPMRGRNSHGEAVNVTSLTAHCG